MRRKWIVVLTGVVVVLSTTGCGAVVGAALALPGAALTTVQAASTLASMQVDATVGAVKGGVAVAEGGLKVVDTTVSVLDHIGEASHKSALRKAERTALKQASAR